MNNLNPGYYRVLYDDHFATLIEKQLKCNRSSLGPLARSQLVFDYWVFENQGTFITSLANAFFVGTLREQNLQDMLPS